MRPIQWPQVLSVLIGCLVLIFATGLVSFSTRPCRQGEEGEEICPSFVEWIDQDTSTKSILVGAAAGVAFGLIDNILLYVGMSSLESVFKRLPAGGDPNVLAGYGNAFSGLVSAFVSVFLGRLFANVFHLDVDKAPLWSMAIGTLFGSLLGVVVPYQLNHMLGSKVGPE